MLANTRLNNKNFIVILSIFIFISIMFGVDISYLFVLSIWILSMYYSFKQVKNRLLLVGFLSTFFVFLLGGHFVFEYFNMKLNYYFSDKIYTQSNILMGISLIFVIMSHVVAEKIIEARRFRNEIFISEINSKSQEIIKKLSKMLYFITYVFYIYIILHRTIFIIRTSYLNYYVDYNHDISFLTRSIAAMTPHFFYLFLSTLPRKKEVISVFVLQLIYGIVSLLTGRRTDFMLIIVFIIFYFVFRQYYKKDEESWISKKFVLVSLALSPLLLVFLFIFHFLRHDMNLANLSLKQVFLGFFQQQGFSSSVIRLGLYYKDQLRDDVLYSFFGLVKFTRTNSIIRLFYRPEYGFSYLKNSVDFALKGNSMSHILSYLAIPTYLKGWAVGSSYIAELYQDFGYLGIVIGNSIYGSLMAILSYSWMRVKKYNVWISAISFSLIDSFLKAPRWNFDIIFTEFLSLGRWSAFLGVFILYKIVLKLNIEEKLLNFNLKSVIISLKGINNENK